MNIRKRGIEIKMPLLGADEPVAEVVTWLVPVGTVVEIDQDLLELNLDGASFILPSPLDGILRTTLVEPGELVATDQVLAVIEAD